MSVDLSLPAATPGTWDTTQPEWTATLAQLSDAKDLAQLDGPVDAKYTFQLNRPGVAEFKLDLTHPAIPYLLSNPHALIKVYKRKALAMICETTSLQPAGDSSGRRIAIVATEAPYVRLALRFIGQSAAGVYFDTLDRGEIARQIIADQNAVDDTEIKIGGIGTASVCSAGPWYYKSAMETITELGAPLNGFDHWFVPADPYRDINSAIAYFQCAPNRMTVRDAAVFEFGDGRGNIREYGWQIDLSGRITRAYSLPPGYPDNLGLVIGSASDATTEAAIGRREAVISSDLVDEDLRQELTDEHVSIRKNPRSVFTFQPHVNDFTGRVPSFQVDYGIGDIIRGRVKDSGILLLDAWVRVYGAVVEPDVNGTEITTLTVVDE